MAYEKQNFENRVIDADGNVATEGTTLKAEHLNHMEEGIAAAEVPAAVKNAIAKMLGAAVTTDSGMAEYLAIVNDWASGSYEPGDEPGETTPTVIPVSIALGNTTVVDGSYIAYTTADKTRAVTNPIALYVESGKTYTFKLGSYETYKLHVSGVSTTETGVDFTVEDGTKKNFSGDYARIFKSGWQTSDYTLTPDGTYQVMYLTLGKLDNAELTSEDATALNELLTITVE